MCNRTQHLEFMKFKIMKLLKKSFLGIAFLLALGFTSIAGEAEKVTAEEDLLFSCSQTYTSCDRLYPRSFSGFDACMVRGGCHQQ